jgi:predicted enzyme related to lactoylglutathione lyase
MPNPVVYFEILSKDPGRLREFYHEMFAWEIGGPTPGSGIADYTQISGAKIQGGIGALPENGYAGHVTFYIGVADIAQSFDDVVANGGTKMMGPDHVPGGPIIGLFQDPQGNTVGLVQFPA